MGDGDSIAGEVVSTIAGELSKLGKSVTSQITRSNLSNSSTPGDFSLKDQAKGFGKSLTTQVFGGSDSSQLPKSKPVSEPTSISDQLKKFGTSLTGQLSGSDYTSEQISEMTKRDDHLSEQEREAVRAKIAQIYGEHAVKRKKEKQLAEQQQVQIEQGKKEEKEMIQVRQKQEVNPMVERAKAEIKNYGAE